MSEDKITELVMKVTGELAALNANMRSVLDTLANHAERIRKLELHPSNAVSIGKCGEGDFKTELLRLLAKATVIGLCVIATLTGASGLISKVVGN